MLPRPTIFSPDLIEKARAAHMEGASQREVAGILGVSAPTAGKRIRLWGWPDVSARYERCYIRVPKEVGTLDPHVADTHTGAPVMDVRGMVGRPSAAAREPEPVPHLADGQIGEKLRKLLIREMMKVEAGAVPPPLAARTLASLAQTFRVLTRLPAAPLKEPEEALDVDALRMELTRRIEAMMEEDEENVPARAPVQTS